jgi:hypothetical protein
MQDENAATCEYVREGENPTTERVGWRGRVGKRLGESSPLIKAKSRD